MTEPSKDKRLWRTGRSVGRTIYIMIGDEPSKEDILIGLLDTPELAQTVVDVYNSSSASTPKYSYKNDIDDFLKVDKDPIDAAIHNINIQINTQHTAREIDKIIMDGGGAGEILNFFAEKIKEIKKER
jgi:hypothetical protein